MKTSQLEHFFIPAKNKGWTDGNKVMIVLHGLGDSLDSYKVFVQEVNVTGLNYLLVNAPVPYFMGHSWYDIPPGDPNPGIDDSVTILLDVIEEVKMQGYDYQDIILCGFSQGGCIVMETLYKSKVQLGGVAALSPRLYEERIPSTLPYQVQKTPVYCAHGNFDDVIPFKQTENSVRSLINKGLQIDFNDFDMGHEIDPMEILSFREWLNELL